MNIVFKNKGILSLLDLTTMGDSCKRDDSSKIGKFDSGLKYTLSILYKNGIDVDIYSGDFKYTISSRVISDDITGKTKELLVISQDNEEWGEPVEHVTAFSPNLGFEWKVWMAIRELYSNCLDEAGEVIFTEDTKVANNSDETTIIVHDNGMLQEIINNWDNYFLPTDKEPIYIGSGVKIYDNDGSEFLKLYKNKILIFQDKNVKAKYSYDYNEASIDEMRMLNDKSGFISEIVYDIANCTDVDFIRSFLSHSDEDYFESKLDYYHSFNRFWVEEINKMYKEYTERGEVFAPFPGLYSKFIEDSRIEIGVKRVRYSSPSYSWNTVKIETVSQFPSTAEDTFNCDTFEQKIIKICNKFNFKVKYPIIESKISGFTCISDISKKVLYVSSNFSEETMWEMIKAHFRIDSDDDPDFCFKEYVKLLKNK